MTMIKTNKQNGFTIVELLIVIVVIAILATISIIAYSGFQARANDTVRKSDLSSIAKAMNIYRIRNGDYPNISSGCESGSSGAGNGWLNRNYVTSSTSLSVGGCLVREGYTAEEIIDPSKQIACGGATCRAYMVYTCAAGTWIYANLETIPQSSTATDATCSPSLDTAYGMNYMVKID